MRQALEETSRAQQAYRKGQVEVELVGTEMELALLRELAFKSFSFFGCVERLSLHTVMLCFSATVAPY